MSDAICGATLPFHAAQPIPTSTRVANRDMGGCYATAIYREWADGDRAKCRLCSLCTAANDRGCLRVVTQSQPMSRETARLFSDLVAVKPSGDARLAARTAQ